VRPEKIQIDKSQGAAGIVKEVEYLGPSTRFIVDLDAGARLVVLRQNTEESAVDVMSMRGKKVNLSWAKESEYQVN
jgi:putative spermidine/putrescine transport system ATP-binding protein